MARKPKVNYKDLPDTDECIDHCQKGNADGYGHIGGKRLHRAVYEHYYKFMPKLVMHKCDNPRCINPKHLQAGDWGSNNKDRASKGRSAKVRLDLRKVSQDQADWVRSVYTKKRGHEFGLSGLASKLCVDRNVIYNILKGKSHYANIDA